MNEPTQAERHRRERIEGYAALFIAIALFSTIEVAVKLVGPEIPPLRLATFRFLLTGALLLAPALQYQRRHGRHWRGRDLGILAMLGFVGVTLSLSFYHVSLRYMPANAAAIVFSANPVYVALFAPWLLGERSRRRQMAAVVVGLAGVAVIGLGEKGLGPHFGLGVWLMTAASVAFALYSVLAKKHMHRFGARVITCGASLFGGALMLPLSLACEGSPFVALSASTVVFLLYLSVIATAVAYLLYFSGFARIGAARGSMFFFLKPVLASVFAWLVLGEPLPPKVLAGGAVILAALALAVVHRRRMPVAE